MPSLRTPRKQVTTAFTTAVETRNSQADLAEECRGFSSHASCQAASYRSHENIQCCLSSPRAATVNKTPQRQPSSDDCTASGRLQAFVRSRPFNAVFMASPCLLAMYVAHETVARVCSFCNGAFLCTCKSVWVFACLDRCAAMSDELTRKSARCFRSDVPVAPASEFLIHMRRLRQQFTSEAPCLFQGSACELSAEL